MATAAGLETHVARPRRRLAPLATAARLVVAVVTCGNFIISVVYRRVVISATCRLLLRLSFG